MKVRKKILYSHFKGILDGGSDHCLYNYLIELDQSKFEPYLIYCKKNNYVEQLERHGIKLIYLPIGKNEESYDKYSFIPKRITYLFFLFLEISQILRIIHKTKVDIVHTNHNLRGDRSAIIASILLRKQIICHNRGLHNPLFFDRFISKFISKIICISNFSKNVYINNGIQRKKCSIIFDGIDLEIFKSGNHDNQNIRIGCIGRLEKWKGQEVLIDAAEILCKENDNISFLFVGDGSNRRNLVEKIKSKGLDKNFELTGAIKDVKKMIDKCSIVVHTSIEPEPFGMIIIEAMAMSKPVIATDFGGPKEIITDKHDGILIKANDPSILAEVLISLIKDEKVRTKLGENARVTIEDKFDISQTIKAIEDSYSTVITKNCKVE